MKNKILYGLLALIVVFCLMSLIDAGTGIGLTSLAVIPPLAFNFPAHSSIELRQAKQDVYVKANEMLEKAKTEKRSLTDDEKTDYDAYMEQMRKLDLDIKRAEEKERRAAEMAGEYRNKENEKQEKKEVRSYSFVKAIRESVSKSGLTGLEKEMAEEARSEFSAMGTKFEIEGQLQIPSIVLMTEQRAMTATGQTSVAGDQGGLAIQTDKTTFIQALQANMEIMGLGAKFFENLVGNVSMPKRSSALYAGWNTENGDAAELSDTLGQVTLSPKRLAAFQKISKQLLTQTSYGIEAMIRNWMITSMALALDKAAIQGTGSNNQPYGILATSGIGSVAVGENGGAPTWEHIIKLETEIAIDEALRGKLAYLTNSKVRGKLKRTMIDTYQGGPVWGLDNMINGYKAVATSHVPSSLTKGTTSGTCSAIILGDFSSLMVGQWGGLDIVVDPYTLAKAGQLQLTVNGLYDVALEHAESFAACLDAVTT